MKEAVFFCITLHVFLTDYWLLTTSKIKPERERDDDDVACRWRWWCDDKSNRIKVEKR